MNFQKRNFKIFLYRKIAIFTDVSDLRTFQNLKLSKRFTLVDLLPSTIWLQRSYDWLYFSESKRWSIQTMSQSFKATVSTPLWDTAQNLHSPTDTAVHSLILLFSAHGSFGAAFWLHFATTVIQIVTGKNEIIWTLGFYYLEHLKSSFLI